MSDVNGDALLSLGPQPIGKKGEVHGAAGAIGPVPADRRHLVFIDRFRVVQKTPDESGLAVVHTSRRGKAQQAEARPNAGSGGRGNG